MRSRLALSAALMLAALIPATHVSAQDRGGGGGFGGGGRAAGGLNMGIAPRYLDLVGPFAFDSVTALLSLQDEQKSKLDAVRAQHLAKTKVLRDSIGVLAVEAGYTTPVPVAKPAAPVAKEKAIKEYTKMIDKLHKIDSDYYLKQVHPLMNPGQWVSYKTWVNDRATQRGNRGGGMGGGMGGMGGRGGDYSGN